MFLLQVAETTVKGHVLKPETTKRNEQNETTETSEQIK